MFLGTITISMIISHVKKHKHDSDNLLFVEEVKYFGYLLNDRIGVVLEALHGEGMVRNDTESADHIVGDLEVLNAFMFQVSRENVESVLAHELLGKFICLKKIKKSEGIRLD